MMPNSTMTPRQDLESAVADAATMARIAVEYIGQVLRLDQRPAPALTNEDSEHLSFLVLDMCLRAERANEALEAFWKS